TWPAQRTGTGQVTTVSFQVPPGSLGFWSNRLKELRVDHRMVTAFDSDSLVLRDADGIEIALVAQASDDRWKPWPEAPVDPEHAIRAGCCSRSPPTVRVSPSTSRPRSSAPL